MMVEETRSSEVGVAVTINGKGVNISETEIGALASSIRGQLIRPGDNDYDRSRAIWNGMIDCRPAFIARCLSTDDVLAAVNFARFNEIRVSVRGGGHGVSGNAVCDGGLVIDLSSMTHVTVNPHGRTVKAGAGALLGQLDGATQEFGLAVPAGTVSETGIAGLTLGGGLGWLMRNHGLTCDNLIGVDMVTAAGESLHANDETHPHLMWGLRGGGGNFGIVTSFEYRAHPVGPTVLAGFVLHPIEHARDFFEFYSQYVECAPDQLTTIGVMRMMPPVPSVPEELHGVQVAGTGVCYVGDIDRGQQLLEPLRGFGSPLVDSITPTQFVDHQAVLDQGAPAGLNYYEKSENLPSLTPELIDTLVDHGQKVSSPYGFVGLFQLGGAVSRIGEHDTAYTQRDAAFSLVISAGWGQREDTNRHVTWVRSFWNALQPFSAGGGYINFMSHDDGEDRIKAAYGPAKYERLADLKNTYDPENLLRFNQNIKPTG